MVAQEPKAVIGQSHLTVLATWKHLPILDSFTPSSHPAEPAIDYRHRAQVGRSRPACGKVMDVLALELAPPCSGLLKSLLMGLVDVRLLSPGAVEGGRPEDVAKSPTRGLTCGPIWDCAAGSLVLSQPARRIDERTDTASVRLMARESHVTRCLVLECGLDSQHGPTTVAVRSEPGIPRRTEPLSTGVEWLFPRGSRAAGRIVAILRPV